LHPKQIRSHWDRWGADRPKDAACLDDLVLKEGFTQDGAATFLRVYDATIAYAGLTEADKTHDKPGGAAIDAGEAMAANGRTDAVNADIPPIIANVGDYIQWTSAGVDQFAPSARVSWVADDRRFLRVHGSLTGIPMNEISIVEPPKAPQPLGAPSRASSAYVGPGADLNVLLTGGRLQITADVDLEGLARLKEVLGHYETILKLLAPTNP
jgi:hypothetical protein